MVQVSDMEPTCIPRDTKLSPIQPSFRVGSHRSGLKPLRPDEHINALGYTEWMGHRVGPLIFGPTNHLWTMGCPILAGPRRVGFGPLQKVHIHLNKKTKGERWKYKIIDVLKGTKFTYLLNFFIGQGKTKLAADILKRMSLCAINDFTK